MAKTHKAIKFKTLNSNYVHKGEKTKFGGAGDGAVFRDKTTGKDYLLKRPEMDGATIEAKKMANWRCWDELLAAKILKVAGLSVPSMFAVEDNNGLIYVASKIIPNAANCKAERFKKLPEAIKGPILSSHLLHCWIGNRDLINVTGENYIIDKDNRVFNVDLGASIFSGFRSVFPGQDTGNFSKDNFDILLLETGNTKFGKLVSSEKGVIGSKDALNKNQVEEFFADLFTSPEAERRYILQGALTLARFSDKDIEEIVNSTGHTKENKQKRIEVLIGRKECLLTHIKNKYGAHSLEEEQMSLDLQRVFHRQGIFNPYFGTKNDAIVSYRSQYANAVKPNVQFAANGSIQISFPNNDESARNKIMAVVSRLNKGNIDVVDKTIIVKPPTNEFQAALYSELSANILQAYFFSHGYSVDKTSYSNLFHQYRFKGDGWKGFRPAIQSSTAQITISLPPQAVPNDIADQIANEFNIDRDSITIANNSLQLNNITLSQFAHLLMENNGARKTAVISENEEGKILAGRLDPSKKGVSGFATAGGGSDRPYNPELAAKEESEDEFGHTITEEAKLIPIGSTLPNSKAKNIFLIPAGHTSATQELRIDYAEFQDNSIKYYSFDEFRVAFVKDQTKFDRTSVNLYLNYYQREIQKALTQAGVDNVIVQISKSPATVGQIYLKPSIEHYDFSKKEQRKIAGNKELMTLLKEIYPEPKYKFSDKESKQGKNKIIYRQIVELDKGINPAIFHKFIINNIINNIAAKNNVVVQDQSTPKTEEEMTLVPVQEDSHASPVSSEVNMVQQEEVVTEHVVNMQKKRLSNLYNKIELMEQYGKQLKDEGAHEKGVAAIHLADVLKTKLDNFLSNVSKSKPTQERIDAFKEDFTIKLHENDELMHSHRALWKPIIVNILIALTGVGFLALLINMACEAVHVNQQNKEPKLNQFLFFAKTNTQLIGDSIENELNETLLSSPL